MSKIFPGIRVSMGSWSYTTIRIKFSDLGETFVFQRYLDEENKDSLDVVGNREVNQGRATKDMGKIPPPAALPQPIKSGLTSYNSFKKFSG